MYALIACALLSTSQPTAPNGFPVSETNEPAYVQRMFEHVVKVAAHIWALNAPASARLAPLANEMLVEQRDGLVLIDSGKTRGAGKRIVALIRSVSSKPLKAVILTHWHQDHVLGLGPVVEAWPGVQIVATASTAERIAHDPSYKDTPISRDATAERDAARATAMKQYAAQFLPKVRDRTLTPAQHQGWAEMVGVLDQRALDEKGTYLVHPTRTFTGSFRIDDPEAPVEAIEVGQGHTVSDSVVWAPKQRVLAAGDLVVYPIPYGGSHLLEWPAALDRMIALRPRTVVPGHGDVLNGTAYLRTVRELFAGIDAKASALPRSPLLSDEQVAARVDLAPERRTLTHGDSWLNDMFDQSVAGDPAEAYHELTGRP